MPEFKRRLGYDLGMPLVRPFWPKLLISNGNELVAEAEHETEKNRIKIIYNLGSVVLPHILTAIDVGNDDIYVSRAIGAKYISYSIPAKDDTEPSILACIKCTVTCVCNNGKISKISFGGISIEPEDILSDDRLFSDISLANETTNTFLITEKTESKIA